MLAAVAMQALGLSDPAAQEKAVAPLQAAAAKDKDGEGGKSRPSTTKLGAASRPTTKGAGDKSLSSTQKSSGAPPAKPAARVPSNSGAR